MKKGDYLATLLRAKQTVFTVRDAMLLWQDTNAQAVKVRLNYYARHGDIYRVRRGIYAKDHTYDHLELATKIFTPSYISFETVLRAEGAVFQHYEQIFVASYLTREIVVDGQRYTYRRMKDTILTDPAGIRQTGEYAIATPARAFLDVLYHVDDYHVDTPDMLDWDEVQRLLPVYGGNKRMQKRVSYLKKHYGT